MDNAHEVTSITMAISSIGHMSTLIDRCRFDHRFRNSECSNRAWILVDPCETGQMNLSYQGSLNSTPGGCPTNGISIEFEIRPKFAVLWFKIYPADLNEILHSSRQYNCRDVCKISLGSVKQIINYSTPNLNRISNSIEIPLVGRAPGVLSIFRGPFE